MTGVALGDDAVAHFERGLVAQRAGRSAEAEAAYRAALAVDATLAPAHFNLGLLLREAGATGDATRCFEMATKLRPGTAEGWLHLGVCLEELEELDGAVRAYRRATEIDPGFAVAWFDLGNAHRKEGRLGDAAAAFERALALAPDAPEIWLNLGNVLRELGELPRAVDALRRAVALKPNAAEPQWNLALALLAGGALEEGWRGYEQRWPRIGRDPRRGLTWPLWRGEDVRGKRLLLWREQGLGDEILFATCVPDLIARGAEVTLALDPRLVGLFGRAFPDVEVVTDQEWGARPFDFHLPLGSLPGLLRRARVDFRPRWSYLIPERAALSAAHERVRSAGPGHRVGICWRSGLRGMERTRYYAGLADWAPILQVPGVVLINLQYDDAETELATVETDRAIKVHRWPAIDLRDDLESVAGLIWNLDLVITAPTAVGSLAGALGIETWQIDPGTDWTTFGEDRSPWLPAIRNFRRESGTTDWRPLLAAVAAELRDRIASGAGPRTPGRGTD
jgi:Flp pilus assembly protein TadD